MRETKPLVKFSYRQKSSKITVFAFLISIYLFEMRSDFRNLTCNTLAKLNLDKKISLF